MARKILAKHIAKGILRASEKRRKPAHYKKHVRHEAEIKPGQMPEDYSAFLKNRIQGLEHELRISERLRQEEVEINKKRIEELFFELDHLRKRVFGIKTERQRRAEELERKIAERAKTTDVHKVMEMEHQLKELQEKYEELKKSEKYSKDSLEGIELTIESLKKKIEAKKKQAFPEAMPAGIKHVIRFFEKPAPKRGIPAEEIRPELPSLPSAKEMAGRPLEEGEIPAVPWELVKKPKKPFGHKLRVFFLGKPKPKISKTL
jgi:hypothetical protein